MLRASACVVIYAAIAFDVVEAEEDGKIGMVGIPVTKLTLNSRRWSDTGGKYQKVDNNIVCLHKVHFLDFALLFCTLPAHTPLVVSRCCDSPAELTDRECTFRDCDACTHGFLRQ
jgi:hypothetical protein